MKTQNHTTKTIDSVIAQSTANVENSFLKPFSREVLREDILNLCFLHARKSFLFAEKENIAKTYFGRDVRIPMAGDSPDRTPQNLGICYDEVSKTEFAQALERQYNYAFEALIDGPGEPLGYETGHTWTAATLLDFKDSLVVSEIGTYGGGWWKDSIDRCLRICELANARFFMETGEVFSHLRGVKENDDATSLNGLTVRQMALLSGMEEMTIRTAASRKGPSYLVSSKEGTRTVFERSVAKEWLQTKGRYMPVQRFKPESSAEAMGRTYENADQFLKMVKSLNAGKGESSFRLTAGLKADGVTAINQLQPEHLANQVMMTKIAHHLGLPPKLFVVRAQEAATRDELRALEHKADVLQRSARE